MKVSVLMITYNHERFIAQALDSVLMQQVDFDYEIVVGEDCSTDSTRQILIEYQKKYPEKIRLLLPGKNLGMIGNMVETCNACRGDYIALLEGDDLWTSPQKLQKQVDLLEAHPECSGCFHNVLMAHEGAPEKNRLFHEAPLAKRFFALKDILSSHFIPTCSTVFRAGMFTGFPDWYLEMPMGDWPLHILNAEHGPYAYLDEVMATYRIHGGGAWSGNSRLAILDKTIHACHRIDRYLVDRHPREIRKPIRALIYGFENEAFEIHKAQSEFGKAFTRLIRAFIIFPRFSQRNLRCFISLLDAWCGCHRASGKEES
jgi:glycosyltransferase involved in cell wall biosynthesis